jgi:hypothetical protein
MAVAKLFPEPEERGRGKKSKFNLDFTHQYVLQARTVLKWTLGVASRILASSGRMFALRRTPAYVFLDELLKVCGDFLGSGISREFETDELRCRLDSGFGLTWHFEHCTVLLSKFVDSPKKIRQKPKFCGFERQTCNRGRNRLEPRRKPASRVKRHFSHSFCVFHSSFVRKSRLPVAQKNSLTELQTSFTVGAPKIVGFTIRKIQIGGQTRFCLHQNCA